MKSRVLVRLRPRVFPELSSWRSSYRAGIGDLDETRWTFPLLEELDNVDSNGIDKGIGDGNCEHRVARRRSGGR